MKQVLIFRKNWGFLNFLMLLSVLIYHIFKVLILLLQWLAFIMECPKRVNIKNSKSKYALTCGIAIYPEQIERSIDIIMTKAPDYEFRTTVVRELHDIQDIIEIANYIKAAKKYFLQSYVDSGDIISNEFSAYSTEEMLKILEAARKSLPTTVLRGI